MIGNTHVLVIKFRYVHKDIDRHGNVRIYFMRRGQRKVRIREALGSVQFLKRYHDILRASENGELSPAVSAPSAGPRPEPGTLKWLVTTYVASAAFKRQLDPITQRTRLGIFNHILDEQVRPDSKEIYANFPIDRLTTKALRVLRDRKADRPEAANNRVKVLRGLFKWAVADEFIITNPARDLTMIKTASDGWHSWTLDEVAAYEMRHPLGSKARLALCLLLFAGLRRSDAVQIGHQNIQGGVLRFRQHKGRNRYPITIEIPVLPPLAEAIAATPVGDVTFLETEAGQPFSIAGFGNWFRDRCDEAALPQCSAHGLRKAGATRAAENGATAHQLMSMFGWKTLQEAEHYTKAAERRLLAASGMPLLLGAQQRAECFPPAAFSRDGGDKRDKKPNEINRNFSRWCPEEDSNLHDLATAST
jgi:site-specific recombinase XerD